MEWEQFEEQWRELKGRIKGGWSVLSLYDENALDDELSSAPRGRRRPVDDEADWRELEASIFKGDLEQLIRDFESSGTHH